MTTLGSILAIFFTLAVDRSLSRLYWDLESEEKKKEFIGTIMVAIFLIATIMVSCFFIWRSYVTMVFSSIPFFPYYALMLLSTYISVFSIMPKIYYQINSKARVFVGLSLLQFVLSVGFVLYFVVLKDQKAVGVLNGAFYSQLVLLPLFLGISFRIGKLSFNMKYLWEGLKYSIPMIPALLSAWILNLSDRIFVGHYSNLTNLGIYSLGYKIGSIVVIIAVAFFCAYEPIFYSLATTKGETSKTTLKKYNDGFILLILLLCFGVSFFSKDLIFILFNKGYREAYRIVPIIAFASFFTAVMGLLNFSIYQHKKSAVVMLITLFSAVLNVVLNYMLIPSLGIYGAALATLMSFIVFFIVEYQVSKKYYFIPMEWNVIVPLIGSLGTLIYVFNYMYDFSLVLLLVKIIVAVVVSVIIVKMSGIYDYLKAMIDNRLAEASLAGSEA